MQASDRPEIAHRAQAGGPLRGYSLLQSLFILRLQGLIARRQQYAGRLSAADWRMRLLDKALYSTYRDCVALGLADEARRLLRATRQAQPH